MQNALQIPKKIYRGGNKLLQILHYIGATFKASAL